MGSTYVDAVDKELFEIAQNFVLGRVAGVAGIWGPPVFGHPHITRVLGMGVPIPLSEIGTP